MCIVPVCPAPALARCGKLVLAVPASGAAPCPLRSSTSSPASTTIASSSIAFAAPLSFLSRATTSSSSSTAASSASPSGPFSRCSDFWFCSSLSSSSASMIRAKKEFGVDAAPACDEAVASAGLPPGGSTTFARPGRRGVTFLCVRAAPPGLFLLLEKCTRCSERSSFLFFSLRSPSALCSAPRFPERKHDRSCSGVGWPAEGGLLPLALPSRSRGVAFAFSPSSCASCCPGPRAGVKCFGVVTPMLVFGSPSWSGELAATWLLCSGWSWFPVGGGAACASSGTPNAAGAIGSTCSTPEPLRGASEADDELAGCRCPSATETAPRA
mmetsp:Transcript_24719/g.62126  ORF Transcript_24719/g.62126 Transcript_24719/m.62126 type:complete len:326 (+) Transcript_24719:1067-2044(+)